MQDDINIVEAATNEGIGDEPTSRTASWNPEASVGTDGWVHIEYAGLELVFERHRVAYLIEQLKAIDES